MHTRKAVVNVALRRFGGAEYAFTRILSYIGNYKKNINQLESMKNSMKYGIIIES